MPGHNPRRYIVCKLQTMRDIKPGGSMAPCAQLFTQKNTGRIVLYPFANNHFASDIHQIKYAVDCVARGCICLFLFAPAEPAERVERRIFCGVANADFNFLVEGLKAAHPELKITKVESCRDGLLGFRLVSPDQKCTLIMVSLETPYLAAATANAVDKAEAVLKARLAEFPEGPGESHSRALLAYPYAVEHEGRLYVAYSNKGGEVGRARTADDKEIPNSNSMELAVIPLDSLLAEPTKARGTIEKD
jgi:hypothetical protein